MLDPIFTNMAQEFLNLNASNANMEQTIIEMRQLIIDGREKDPAAADHLIQLFDMQMAQLAARARVIVQAAALVSSGGAGLEDPVEELKSLMLQIAKHTDSLKHLAALTVQVKPGHPLTIH